MKSGPRLLQLKKGPPPEPIVDRPIMGSFAGSIKSEGGAGNLNGGSPGGSGRQYSQPRCTTGEGGALCQLCQPGTF